MMSQSANGVTRKNWAAPHSFYIRMSRNAGGSANSVFRFQVGEKTSATAFARISGRGVGFEIRGTRFWILAHNGSSLTQTDTGMDFPTANNDTQNFDVLLRSDGAGNVTLSYTTDWTTYTASTSGGPTSINTNIPNVIAVELTNGTDASNTSYQFQTPRLTNQ